MTVTVDALRRGEPEVLDRLLADYGQDIQDVAFAILRDPAEAEDVLADTLLAALDRATSLRDPRALRSWLLRIAVNRALDRRRRRIRVVSLELDHDRPVVSPDATDRIAVLAAMDDLPPRTRAAVVLRYHMDLSIADVAATMGTCPNTVKTLLRRALDKMRTTLTDEPHGEMAQVVARG